MQISDKILSLPPYISTAWKNIAFLQVESRSIGHVLVIELVTGSRVEIPNLDHLLIEKIFTFHAKAVENEKKEKENFFSTAAFPFSFSLPHLENLTPIVQHNEEQKDSPLLPPELLARIVEMTKGLLPEDLSNIQPPEADCNCPHCQIMRAILDFKREEKTAELEEEVVTEEDLKFRTWDVKEEKKKLYSVTNPLDPQEHYNVFLDHPIGCTCGNKNCEHIHAVLRS